MTRKDFVRIFHIGETLEVTSHWRHTGVVGQRRTVVKIGRTEITFHADTLSEFGEPYVVESYLEYSGVARIERSEDDKSIGVYWGDDQYITYQVVES